MRAIVSNEVRIRPPEATRRPGSPPLDTRRVARGGPARTSGETTGGGVGSEPVEPVEPVEPEAPEAPEARTRLSGGVGGVRGGPPLPALRDGAEVVLASELPLAHDSDLARALRAPDLNALIELGPAA